MLHRYAAIGSTHPQHFENGDFPLLGHSVWGSDTVLSPAGLVKGTPLQQKQKCKSLPAGPLSWGKTGKSKGYGGGFTGNLDLMKKRRPR